MMNMAENLTVIPMDQYGEHKGNTGINIIQAIRIVFLLAEYYLNLSKIPPAEVQISNNGCFKRTLCLS